MRRRRAIDLLHAAPDIAGARSRWLLLATGAAEETLFPAPFGCVARGLGWGTLGGQGGHHLGRARVALGGILFEAAQDRRVPTRVEIGHDQARRGRRFLEAL